MAEDLKHGPLGPHTLHLCVDMQRLFAEDTDWHMPWMERVRPVVRTLAERSPERTIFTRFVPAERTGEGRGTWARYYRRWASMTLEHLDPALVDLVPELQDLVPPGEIVDKRVYGPWDDSDLERRLIARGIDTLIISGGETDICVLATIIGAVDRGYRVVVAADAVCSSSDHTHDTLLDLYEERFGQQIEVVRSALILAHWP